MNTSYQVRAALYCFAFAFLATFVPGYCQDVDPLTGRAIIKVPLGSVSAFDLSVSLSLSHQGGALKVSDGPGNAGMGWNANLGGGAITREVRGLPDDFNPHDSINDDYRLGWLSANTNALQTWTPQADDNLAVTTAQTNDWNFINIYTTGHTGPNNANYVDSEPDLFYFQAPGISGKFIFGADGLPKLIPYQDLQITFTAGVFTIKTNTGTVYTFGATESESVTRQAIWPGKVTNPVYFLFVTKSNLYNVPITFTSTWNLSSISNGTTAASIQYTYQDGEKEYTFDYYTGILPNYTAQADTIYYISDVVSPLQLIGIALNKYEISIGWANALVDKITISEYETGDTKEYDFIYKAIHSTSDAYFQKVFRPFLMQVKQTNSCQALPSYAFTYQGIDTLNAQANIPWRTGWGQDFFGYYNGQDNNKNIPGIYFYSGESGARRFRTTPIPGVSATQTLIGGDRSVNSSYNSFGAVTRIDFPTGGLTMYTYEPNKYFDASTNEELYGAGVRVARVTTSGGESAYGKQATIVGWHALTKTYQYGTTDANTITSGKIVYPPVFAFTDGTTIYRTQSDLGTGSNVLYSRVKESTAGQGYRVYQFDLPNVYPDATPAATVSKIAGLDCSPGLLQNGPYTWPFAPLTDNDYQRGYLTRLSEYSEAGGLTWEKRMSYTLPQSTSFVKALRYETMIGSSCFGGFYYSLYQIPVNQSRITTQEVIKQIGDQSAADSTKVITSYAYNNKNMTVQTTKTNDDGSIATGYVKYAQDFAITAPAAGDIQANAIYKLNSTNRYGEVIETYQTFMPIGGTSVVTGAKLNVYKDNGTYVWPYQSKGFPQGLSFTGASANASSFTSDQKYITSATYDYANGLPVGQTNTSLVPSGTHYSTYSGMPLASFANCKGANAVYEGFEQASANGLVASGGKPAYPAGWTGQKSIQLTSVLTLASASPVTKSENTYRVSCWIYAAATGNLLVQAKNGATVQSSLTLNYTTPNQWAYLEGFIDMTNVSSSFTLTVSSATAMQLDDFVALPKSARMSSSTYLPLTGVTSQSDDRGNSTLITYDALGRRQNTFDRKRNLVSKQEYGTQRTAAISLNPNFTASETQYSLGQPITFTAASNACIPGATYSWSFTGSDGSIATASGAVIIKTFTNFGGFNATLTVSAPGYTTASYTDNICVVGIYTVSISIDQSNIYDPCAVNENGQRTFNVSLGSGKPPLGWNLGYEWWYTNANGVWAKLDKTTGSPSGYPQMLPNSYTNEITLQCPAYSYLVYCYVTATAASTINQGPCSPKQVMGLGTSGITYSKSVNCQ